MTQAKAASPHDTEIDAIELDSDALAAIRTMIDNQPTMEEARAPQAATAPASAPAPAGIAPQKPTRKFRKAQVLPRLTAPAQEDMLPPEPDAAPVRTKRRFSLPRLSLPSRKPAALSAAPQAGPPPAATKSVQSDAAQSRLLSYRPTPRHIALAALVLLVVMRPWLVVGIVFLTLFVMTGVFLIMGFDGFWQGISKLLRWYGRHRPARAAVLHARLDAFAVRWDGFLDRFPEGTVDGLYLPDLGELAAAEARHDEAMARRLSGLREDAA
ncbi:hypothetical protein KDD17_12250 [Sulfitobacter albidus]|uniref:Uncharacterized protein n=1 Tax=Sulfitobacter albidus TaxID=2829501 RepID=A0A975JC32_9RHOB|nr:hypothetical protein [Sulfitobacter albidus]QUJ75721.1 hypothetical protein KDD17_12250 [Sulfitobacter albidus]